MRANGGVRTYIQRIIYISYERNEGVRCIYGKIKGAAYNLNLFQIILFVELSYPKT